jgi:hypothetical protein
LEGLSLIWLKDEVPEFSDDLPEWLKSPKGQDAPVYGWYAPPQEDTPVAYIMLYVKEIYQGVPGFLWWSTVPTLRIIRTLAHEVAHHLTAKRGYIYLPNEKSEDEELLADRYANDVLREMTKRWHYKLGQWWLRESAFWHYSQGLLDWREKKYASASAHFYRAWDFNPELEEVASFYWRTKELSITEQMQRAR